MTPEQVLDVLRSRGFEVGQAHMYGEAGVLRYDIRDAKGEGAFVVEGPELYDLAVGKLSLQDIRDRRAAEQKPKPPAE
jgi:hypothetical protein